MPVHEKSPQKKFRPDVSLHPAGINYYSTLSNDFTLNLTKHLIYDSQARYILSSSSQSNLLPH